jgi:UDP-glucose 6-dehydrogenase
MDIAVVGCGKVGLPYLKWLIDVGFDARGYDTDPSVRANIRLSAGPGAVVDAMEDLIEAEWVHISVPTDPVEAGGPLDVSSVAGVVSDIMKVAQGGRLKGFVQRSTCPPGTADRLARTLEGKFAYGMSPSFIRKATVHMDTVSPERLAFGGPPEVVAHLENVHASQECPRLVTNSRAAVEFIKMVENCLDGVLISFWNEMAYIAADIGIEVDDFRQILERIGDRPKFAGVARVPGRAFGLWCLPKDLRAVIYEAQLREVPVSTLHGAWTTNELVENSLGVGMEGGAQLFEIDDLTFSVLKAGIARMDDLWAERKSTGGCDTY